METFEEYEDLAGTGFEGQAPQESAEEAFFKSIYIAGNPLKIEGSDITTVSGKLQIRGLEYNLDNINFIITNIKRVLSNEVKQLDGKMKNICFSYDLKKGRNDKNCGSNSAERAGDKFCSTCRSQIIVNGIYCDNKGQPIKKDGKYVFIFLRAKATKYGSIADYLNKLYNLELDPYFPTSSNSETEKKRIFFEKSVMNHKRFVTNITQTQTQSNYGLVNVFALKAGVMLNNNSVKGILDISKKIVSKFDDKFNWSKRNNQSNFDSYTQQNTPEENQFSETPDEKPPFDNSNKTTNPKKEDKKPEQSNTPADVSFDDFEF